MIIIVFYRAHQLEGGIIGIFPSCIFLIPFVNRFKLCSDTNYEFFLTFVEWGLDIMGGGVSVKMSLLKFIEEIDR